MAIKKSKSIDKDMFSSISSNKQDNNLVSTFTTQNRKEHGKRMNIVVHPMIAKFERPGFLGRYNFRDFVDEKFYRKEIPDGEEFLGLIHPEKFIRKIKKACLVKSRLAEMELTPKCYKIACLGTGTVVLASEEGNFAIQCMNGHHAGRETAMGFNLFNSIAIATQRLVNQGKRVCIIDIDGHHGNGTQNIFYSTDQVLFCSIHQKGAFPGTGKKSETGRGKGKDYTLNIPIPAGSGDDVFLNALEKVIKKAKEFKPDIVGVYAGFDGYYTDELLDLNYSLDGFYRCGKIIGQNFENIFADLGGGYHQDVSKCILSFVRGINQET